MLELWSLQSSPSLPLLPGPLWPSWLVVWVLWHINLYRLFNTKSIFYTNNQNREKINLKFLIIIIIIIRRKRNHLVNFAIPSKKIYGLEDDGDNNYKWCAWNGPQRSGKTTGGIRNQSKNRSHQDYCVV